MTTPVQEAVRRACDEARPAAPCRWPDCYCEGLDLRKMLATLIAQARAEGAAQEREACERIAAAYPAGTPFGDPWEASGLIRHGQNSAARDISEAIRARKEETP